MFYVSTRSSQPTRSAQPWIHMRLFSVRTSTRLAGPPPSYEKGECQEPTSVDWHADSYVKPAESTRAAASAP